MSAGIRCATAICALFLLLLPGCLLTTSMTRVVRQDEKLMPVHFQSEYAQAAFQEEIVDGDEDEVSEFSLGIPFLLGINVKRVISENARYNDLVRRCDSNGDGLISEMEIAAWNEEFVVEESGNEVEIVDGRPSLIHLSFGDDDKTRR